MKPWHSLRPSPDNPFVPGRTAFKTGLLATFRFREKRPGCGSIERSRRWIAMRTLLLVALIVVLGVDAADARRRHHHHRSNALEVPADERVEPGFNGDPRANTPRLRRQPPTIAALVPRDWQPEPQNPNWNGKRFLSPDGTSWLAIYRVSADGPGRSHAERPFRQGRDHHLSARRADVGCRFGFQRQPHFLPESHSGLRRQGLAPHRLRVPGRA